MVARVAGQAPAGTSQRRSLVAVFGVETVVNVAGAFGFLGLVRDPPSLWELAALVVFFVGNFATSAWLDRIGRALERRDMRGLRFGRYGRQVLGRWAWVQALSWLSFIILLGVGGFAFASTF